MVVLALAAAALLLALPQDTPSREREAVLTRRVQEVASGRADRRTRHPLPLPPATTNDASQTEVAPPSAETNVAPPTAPATTPEPTTEAPFGPGEPTSGTRWDLSDRGKTPEFPITECTTPTERSTLARCHMVVPLYIVIMNKYDEAVPLAYNASTVRLVTSRNATHEIAVRVQTIFVDNTGCGRKHRVHRPDANFFESHAEYVGARFNCEQWHETVAKLKSEIGLETIVPPVPLTFGPTQNLMHQDAHERRGVPRMLWAHSDGRLKHIGALERSALNAALLRHPFCVAFTHYDILAVFDVHSTVELVGDWDNYLWYHGDVDYYGRCRHAQLPWSELGGPDVEHVGKGSSTAASFGGNSKIKRRFDVQGRMFSEYHRLRKESLQVDRFELPPKNKKNVGVSVEYFNATRMPDPGTISDAVSRHMRRWMFPWRFIQHRRDDNDAGTAGVLLKIEYLPVDLDREDRPPREGALIESLKAAVGADVVEVYVPD